MAVALDPDQKGKLVWRTQLWDKTPPTADGLVLSGYPGFQNGTPGNVILAFGI